MYSPICLSAVVSFFLVLGCWEGETRGAETSGMSTMISFDSVVIKTPPLFSFAPSEITSALLPGDSCLPYGGGIGGLGNALSRNSGRIGYTLHKTGASFSTVVWVFIAIVVICFISSLFSDDSKEDKE